MLNAGVDHVRDTGLARGAGRCQQDPRRNQAQQRHSSR